MTMDIGGSFRHELTGSFSQGSDSNPTVAMVEASYKANNLHYRYVNCEVNPDQLEAAVKGARAMNWKGFNCSIPHKVEVIKYLDGLGESAALIGAVNCAVNRDGKLIGDRAQVRSQPTNLGVFTARAMMERAKADFAIVNSGGIRDSLPEGKITYLFKSSGTGGHPPVEDLLAAAT